MLFYDVDQIEGALQDLSRRASSQFFLASSEVCQVFAHLETGEFDKAQVPTLGAILHFGHSAKSLRELARMVEEVYPWLVDATKHVSFDQAARDAGLSRDSEIVKETISRLLEHKLNGLLRSCANDIGALVNELMTVHESVRDETVPLDLRLMHANALMSHWRAVIVSGQFVAAVCRHNTRGIGNA